MVPQSEGLIGELLHLLLTPPEVLRNLPEPYLASDYIRAQVDGGLHGDCSEHQRRCPVSFFQVNSRNFHFPKKCKNVLIKNIHTFLQILDGFSVSQLQEDFEKMYGGDYNETVEELRNEGKHIPKRRRK